MNRTADTTKATAPIHFRRFLELISLFDHRTDLQSRSGPFHAPKGLNAASPARSSAVPPIGNRAFPEAHPAQSKMWPAAASRLGKKCTSIDESPAPAPGARQRMEPESLRPTTLLPPSPSDLVSR